MLIESVAIALSKKNILKKSSALRIYEELIEDTIINDWNLKDAAVSRTFAMMYSVFLQVPSKMKETKIKIWDRLVECRKSVAFNKNKMMRKKNRYAAIISYLGMNISYFVGKKFGKYKSLVSLFGMRLPYRIGRGCRQKGSMG